MVLEIENNASDFADDFVVRAADLSTDNFVCTQRRRKVLNRNKRPGVFVAAMAQSSTTPSLWLPCIHLLLGVVLVGVAQAGHCRSGDELTNVSQEALAIGIASIRLEN